MFRPRFRIPVAVQVAAVAVLFAASLGTLTLTTLMRDGRRVSAEQDMRRASDAMARAGAEALSQVRPFLARSPEEWDALHRRLARAAEDVLMRYRGVEGGYYASAGRRFLGAAFPTEPSAVAAARPAGWVRPPEPPTRELDQIETQVDASIRKGKPIFIVESIPPSVVAIRTAPVAYNGEVVGATWTMIRLVDPITLNRSVGGYGLAAVLALGGITLSLGLTAGLARSLRREALTRVGLQAELRRSERLAAMGKLLAGVAHEVRNPLAGIRGITQLWQRGIGLEEEAMSHLLEEVDRLEGIIARLLHFSKADAQEMAPGDLNAVVAEAARLAEAQARGVEVDVSLAPSLPPVDMAAPALIQVFRNLTTNALQAMADGGRLRLETAYDAARASVSVRVSDTGPGLSQKTISHMFEPFFTTKPEGTGLGLAIAREIALAHRGELRAANAVPGPGAVFTLILPIAPQEIR